MGTWGHGLFDDDLALDVKADFERSVASGTGEPEAAAALLTSDLAREILEEIAEDDRDDMFWEESRGLFYAVASIQLDHGVLQDDVKRQTLQAIAVERKGLDPEQNRERWSILDALHAKLANGVAVTPAVTALRAKPPTVKAKAAKPPAKKIAKPAKKPSKPAKPAKKPAKPAKKPSKPAKPAKKPVNSAKKPVKPAKPAKRPSAKRR